MVKIYTRKGDDGTTSLWYGGRVPKHDARTEAYGTLDEAISALGVARALCGDVYESTELHDDILRLQDDLFIAGAELATAPEASDRLEDGVSRVTEEMVDWAEERIDHYMDLVELPPQVRDPRRHDPLRDDRRRPGRDPPRRAPDLPLATGRGAGRRGPAALRQPRLRPRLRDGPLRRRRRPRPLRGPRQRRRDDHGRRAAARRASPTTSARRAQPRRRRAAPTAGGADEGPSPTRLLAASLAACTAITIEMYAERKEWDLDDVEVEVEPGHDGPSPNGFTVTIKVPKELSEEQRERLLQIAGKCPVHRALTHRDPGDDRRPGRASLMDLGLAGRGCIVTGASRGIGRETAQVLCAEGAGVLLVARGEDALARGRRGVRRSRAARPRTLALDVTADDAGERMRRRRRGGLRHRSTSSSTTPASPGGAISTTCPTQTGASSTSST